MTSNPKTPVVARHIKPWHPAKLPQITRCPLTQAIRLSLEPSSGQIREPTLYFTSNHAIGRPTSHRQPSSEVPAPGEFAQTTRNGLKSPAFLFPFCLA